MLLQWAVLEPQGPGNLAVIRFSSPVQVRSLRIFPTGSRPFELQEDIVAVTEPSSLYLDVYFNAYPIGADGKRNPKPSNALVPTSIAYQGGLVDFAVDAGNTEFSTRLMIVRGKFEKLSLAIYGDVVSDATSSPQPYAPKQLLQQASHSALSPALDPANNVNPTELAQSLLRLIPEPDRPALGLIIRLMFCLKPSNEDWEENNFPHLYSDLDQDFLGLTIEKAVEMTSRPVSDAVDVRVLRNFAENLGDSVEEYNDDQAYFLAKLLSQCAPQHPMLVRFIMEHIDLKRMYIEPNLDRPTLLYLLDAAANLDTSRQLNNIHTLTAIVQIRDNPSNDDGARRAASRLYNRIKGWEVLEDSLLNTQSSFGTAAILIKEIAAEENSFGIWLESMISNNEVVNRLLETPSTLSLPCPPIMWQDYRSASHDEFIAFLRAAVGVAAVVAVYAWADSVPVEVCRERTLGVLRLWQNVHGYKEIVNHLMLMRQMAYRLECMLPLDDDLPTQAGIDAEHILKTLALQPESMLRPDFVKVMQNLQVPLNYITDNEVQRLKRVSSLAKQGIAGALRLLTRTPDDFDALEKGLDLRVALAIVIDVLQRNPAGEKEILENMWDEGLNGLPVYLLRHLAKSSSDLRAWFGLSVPTRRAQSELTGEFLACLDVLRLLELLLSSSQLPSRDIILLTESVADIFICTDAADLIFAQESPVCSAAHISRQMCINVLAALAVPNTLNAQTSLSSRTVLKTILTHASVSEAHDSSHHMMQSFWLLDHLLPFTHSAVWGQYADEGRQTWVRQIFPPILRELRTFYVLQEPDNKLHLIRRLRSLDDGCIGLAEWLLLEEQQVLQEAVAFIHVSTVDSLEQRIAFWRVTNAGVVLSTLVQDTFDSSHWAVRTLLQGENANLLQASLDQLLDAEILFESVGKLAMALSAHVAGTDSKLQTTILSTLFRATRCGQLNSFAQVLSLLSGSQDPLVDDKADQEFGDALERIVSAIRSGENLPSEFAQNVFGVLEKVTPLNRSSGVFAFRNLTETSYKELTRWLAEKLPVAEKTKLEAMKLRWSFSGKPRPPPELILSDYTLNTSLDSWETLLAPPVPIPSTPTRKSPAHSAEMLGMITVSPPNALLRSPEVKGLTKTYSNNDFRQLRQQSASRQNTSRLPSRHVDDFEQGSSAIAPLNLNVSSSPPAPLPFSVAHQHRPLPIDPSLPMNPMYYQQ